MGYATSRDDEVEAWEHELDRPDGYPVIATGICLLVVFAIAVTQGLSERSFALWTGILIATGCALLLWIIAYLVTIRHSALRWKLGSLAIIWLCAAAASVWAVRSANTALKYDLTMLDEVEWRGGIAVLPEHPDRGLLSRAAIKLVRALNDEVKKQNALRDGLQPQALENATALQREPSLLADCDRFPRAKPAFATGRQRVLGVFKDFRADVETSAIQPEFKQGFMKEVDRAFAGISGILSTAPRLVDEQLDLRGQACTILARHHWRAQAPSIMMNGQRLEIGQKNIAFTDTGDLKAYNAIVRRSQKVAEEMRLLQASHQPAAFTPE